MRSRRRSLVRILLLVLALGSACSTSAGDEVDADGASSSSTGSVNPEAVRRMHFRRAQPPGCRPAGEHDGGWWCEITSDGGIAVRNVERLREVVRSAEKRAAERDEARESDDVSGEAASRRRELLAGRAALAAVDAAVAKFDAEDAKRVRGGSSFRAGSSSRAGRRVDALKCRKDRTRKDVDDVRYVCTVTSSARVAPESSSADATTQGSTGVDASDESRCDELLAWRAKYEEEDAEGKPEFWRWLSRRHSIFGNLERLREHATGEGGTGTGKIRAAIESKAAKAYKALSRETHPDKLGGLFRRQPRCGDKGTRNMLRAVFDRATDMRNCVMKPLRCELESGERRVEL